MSTTESKDDNSLGRSLSDHSLQDESPNVEGVTVAQDQSSGDLEYDPDKSVGDLLDDLDDDTELPIELTAKATSVSSDKSSTSKISDEIISSPIESSDEVDSSISEETTEDIEPLSDRESIESESASDGYFDDDEWSESSDEVLHSDEESVTVKQNEAVVTWDIDRLYTEEGKVRSKRSLKNSPPILRISNSQGQSADFVLTKELSRILANHLENTNRAYYGIRPKSEMTVKDKLNEAKVGLRENMGKAVIIGGLLAALLIFGIFF